MSIFGSNATSVENRIMYADSTTRFSSRVEHYSKFRPGYPREVAKLLALAFRLTRSSEIADIGSGTGLLSRVFLDEGFRVSGVEPNREMREASEELLGHNSAFLTVDGRAEATALPAASVDLVVAGQAFHWFEVDSTRREWTRILRPGGGVALIWNKRLHESPFMREVEAVIDAYAGERDRDGAIREAGRGRIEGFFAPSTVALNSFPNQQQFDFKGLRGRVVSCSYLPLEGEPGHDEMVDALARIFDRYQTGGTVNFDYRTDVYWGRLPALH
jgi:SAM-dependent methyltransferase